MRRYRVLPYRLLVAFILTLVLMATVVPVASANTCTCSGCWPRSCGIWYRVRWSDTLSEISQRFGVPMGAIMTANNICNPHKIYAGQWLRIPCPPYRYKWNCECTCCAHAYIVRPGDTLSEIAARFHVSMYYLARVNHIRNIHKIYAGQCLYIP